MLEGREVICNIRDRFTIYLRKFKVTDDAVANEKQLASLLNSLEFAKTNLSAILKLLPKTRVYVTNYRLLAKGINILRAKKVLNASPELIVKCCLFVCTFTEPDFSRRHFKEMISDFNPEDRPKRVKKDRK